MIIESKLKFVIPQESVSNYIINCLRQHGNKQAIVNISNKTSITYKQYLDRTLGLICGLRKRGLRKGDFVGLALETCLEYGVVCLAIMACGGVVTPTNPLYTEEEIAKQFDNSKPRFIFASKSVIQKVENVAKDLKFVEEIFSIEPCSNHASVADLIGKGSWADYPLDVAIDPDEDIAFVPYSSGTTGLPKGVMLTHKNIISAILLISQSLSCQKSDCIYLMAPAFHIYGFGILFVGLISGCKLTLAPRFDLREMLQCIQEYKVSILMLVPPVMVLLAKTPGVENFNTSSVQRIVCGAAPLAPSLADEVCMKIKKARVTQGWGLTESVPLTFANALGTPVASVGPISPNTKIKIIDIDTGKILPPNKDGEICAKGPQVMKGYFNNPEATMRTIDTDGWIHTGDIGHVDENGYFYIVDRLKELIKVKGFQVAPAELEAILLRHPKIADAAVIGIHDHVSGELPKAFVVRKDSSLSESEIQKFVEGQVSKYKYLKGGISFIDAIPKSPSGKILRRQLRNLPGTKRAKL